MGLAERRLITDFQNNYFPTWLKEFQTIVGWAMPVEPKWDSFFFSVSDNYSPESLVQSWKDNYFLSLNTCFTAICADQMGKDAVKAALKKIIIEGDHDTTNSSESQVVDGMFIIKHKPFSYSEDVKSRAGNWQKNIEAKI